MAGEELPRRDFLKTAGLGTAAALAGGVAHAPQPAAAAPAAAPEPEIWLTLTPTEQAFVKAAVDTIIPADELTPSGTDCGLATFIDRQLAGGFGNGARLYRQGPFLPGKPELGYQLPLTPREFFRAGIRCGQRVDQENLWQGIRPPDARRSAKRRSTRMETGKADFNAGFTSAFFFDNFLQLTMEGFFADPMYGGNKDKVAWKMIGFPGLPASYRDEIKTYFNKKYDKGPLSIADFS